MRGDRFAATRNAALVGRAFGYILIVGGVFLALQRGSLFGGLWIAAHRLVHHHRRRGGVAQMSVERSLHGVTVRDVMEADPPASTRTRLSRELVNERMLRGEHRSFLVRYADGGLAGIVTLSDVRRLPSDRWADARVTDVMTRFADLATVEAELPVDRAMQILQQREVGQLPVVESDGRTVVGMLTRLGVLRLIDNRAKLGA